MNVSDELPVDISHHARKQMRERGATQAEVIAAIREGEAQPARNERTMYRRNFQYDDTWGGRYYRIKQVAPVVAE